MTVPKIVAGICAACLIACMLVAGCMTQSSGSAPQGSPSETIASGVTPGAIPAATITTAGTPEGSDNSGFVYSSDVTESPDMSQVTLAPDEAAVPNGTGPEQTLTMDHDDMGDILP